MAASCQLETVREVARCVDGALKPRKLDARRHIAAECVREMFFVMSLMHSARLNGHEPMRTEGMPQVSSIRL